jgi:hypothetical protein
MLSLSSNDVVATLTMYNFVWICRGAQNGAVVTSLEPNVQKRHVKTLFSVTMRSFLDLSILAHTPTFNIRPRTPEGRHGSLGSTTTLTLTKLISDRHFGKLILLVRLGTRCFAAVYGHLTPSTAHRRNCIRRRTTADVNAFQPPRPIACLTSETPSQRLRVMIKPHLLTYLLWRPC